MQIPVLSPARHLLVAVTAAATLAIPVLAGAPAEAATHKASTSKATPPKAAPPKAASVFDGPLTRAGKAKLLRTKTPAQTRDRIQGKDTASVFCDPYQRASWGYWVRCHVIVVPTYGLYYDYYEYDYWTGTRWAFWFTSQN